MMYKLLFLTFALAMNKSASQNLEATPSCIEEGTTVTLRCETTNFTSAIFFFIGSNSKGGCFSSGTCNTAIDGYEQPTQSGTYTEMIITAYNHSKDGGDWTCSFGGISSNIYTVKLGDCPTLQTSALLATKRTKSVNTFLEYNNITTPMITGNRASTRDISASTISNLNTETTNHYRNIESSNLNVNSETTNFYANTKTSNYNANIKSTNVFENTETIHFSANNETNEIETETSGTVSNSMWTYQSIFITTAANDISESGFADTTSQNMTDIFASPVYSVSSNVDIKLTSSFLTNHVLSQSVSETSFSNSIDTQSDNLFYIRNGSSGSDSYKYSDLSMTISPSHVDPYIASFSTRFLVPSLTTDTLDSVFEIQNVSRARSFLLITETKTTNVTPLAVHSSPIHKVVISENPKSILLSHSLNDNNLQRIITSTVSTWTSDTSVVGNILFTSKIVVSSCSSYQSLVKTIEPLQNSVASQLSLSIIDTLNLFIKATNIRITSNLDDTSISFDVLTGGFKTFLQDNAASASTSLSIFFQSTDHDLSLQTSEYQATVQTKYTSFVTLSVYEPKTDNAATGIYSTEIKIPGRSYMHTSVMHSKTQLSSINTIRGSISDFHSKYFVPYSKLSDVLFSSEISEYMLSTLQSASLLLPFNTIRYSTDVYSYMKTNLPNLKTQFGKLTMDQSVLTNSSSIQISTVLSDCETTCRTTTINFNVETMSSIIHPSSQQTNSGTTYIKIGSSFKDSLFSLSSFSGPRTSNDPAMTSLSSGMVESISTLSNNTEQSRLSEKNKFIIIISTTSVIVTIIVVILLTVFAKVYRSKANMNPHKEHDNIIWKNNSPHRTAFPDYTFTGKNIFTLLNTSSSSSMHPYERNWKDIV